MEKNTSYISPCLKDSVNMFIENFIGLQESHYEDEDPLSAIPLQSSHNNTILPEPGIVGMPPEVNTNVSQSLRVQTPIDLNAATTLMGRFATPITPVSLRSSSSLSENSSSESTSRNSSIFFSSFFQSRVTKLSRHNHTSIGYSNWRSPI